MQTLSKTLRELAADYSKGFIKKEDYRKSRSTLIKGIVSGQIPVKAIDYPPPLTLTMEEITIKKIAAGQINMESILQQFNEHEPITLAKKKKRFSLFAAIGIHIIIVLTIIIILFYSISPKTSDMETNSINMIKEESS